MLIEVYTDGSATVATKPGGYGYAVVFDGQKVIEGNGYMEKASNNDAELEAAIQGLACVLKMRIEGKIPIGAHEIFLVSDSQIVLGWVTGAFKFKQKAKMAKFHQLQHVVKKLNVQTRWVKGHTGDEHNERCDELANMARKQFDTEVPKKKSTKKKSLEIEHSDLESGIITLEEAKRMAITDCQNEIEKLKAELATLLLHKTITPEELDQKMGNVVDFSGARMMREADTNLSEIVELTNNMAPEQLKEFDLKHRREAAGSDPTITVGPDDWDLKDIFLRTKIGISDIYSIIGLHAIGHAEPYEYTLQHQDGKEELIKTNFMALEAWGNEYDDDMNILGRGSFRLHTNNIESYAKEMLVEGWEIYEGPKRKA